MSDYTFLDIVQQYIVKEIDVDQMKAHTREYILWYRDSADEAMENFEEIFDEIVQKIDKYPQDTVILGASARTKLITMFRELVLDGIAKGVMDTLHIRPSLTHLERGPWIQMAVPPQSAKTWETAAARTYALIRLATGNMSTFADDDGALSETEMVSNLGYNSENDVVFDGGKVLLSEKRYFRVLDKLQCAGFTNALYDETPLPYSEKSIRAYLEKFANGTETILNDEKLREELAEWGDIVFFDGSGADDEKGKELADDLFSPLKLDPQIKGIKDILGKGEIRGLRYFALHAMLLVYTYIKDNPDEDPFIRLGFYYFTQQIRVLFV